MKDDKPFVKLHLSFFELLGNEATDLLKTESKSKSTSDDSKENSGQNEAKKMLNIKEDQFGKIQIQNRTEILIENPDQFQTVTEEALKHRRTETTFKNDTSSRSHAICMIRVENTILKSAEDGMIFIVDLAGSENASDAQFHDKSLIKETQLINKSLMALKDCIRNRALSAVNLDQYYHIPYRLSKLTLLLKDAFEV